VAISQDLEPDFQRFLLRVAQAWPAVPPQHCSGARWRSSSAVEVASGTSRALATGRESGGLGAGHNACCAVRGESNEEVVRIFKGPLRE